MGAHLRHQRRRTCSRSSRTFASVFPQGTMWLVGGGDLLLIGAKDGEILPRLAAIARRRRKRHASAQRWRRRNRDGHGAVRAALAVRRRPARDGALRRRRADPDRRPDGARVFGSARHLRPQPRRQCRGDPRAWRPSGRRSCARPSMRATDADWVSRGTMHLKSQAFANAYAAFQQAVTLNGRNAGRCPACRTPPAAPAGWTRSAVCCAHRRPRAGQRHGPRSSCRACWRSPATSRARCRRGDRRAAARARRPARGRAAGVGARRRRRRRASRAARRRDGRRAFPTGPTRATTGRPRCSCAASRRTRWPPLRAVVDGTPGPRARTEPARRRVRRRRAARLCAGGVRGVDPRESARCVRLRERRDSSACSQATPPRPSDYFASALTIDPSSKTARDGLAQARAPKF